MEISVMLLSDTARLPEKMTENAAGYDIFADLAQVITINPFQRILISTGFAIALPEGYEAQIRPRSGLAVKYGITVINSPGTIDSDYRGEVKIGLINLSETPFHLEPQMRIAQMIVSKHEYVEFVLKKELPDTARGKGGFGHTNYK